MFNAEMRLRQVMFITRRVPCTIAKAKGNAGSVHSQYDFKLMREEGSILFLENDFAEKVLQVRYRRLAGLIEQASRTGWSKRKSGAHDCHLLSYSNIC